MLHRVVRIRGIVQLAQGQPPAQPGVAQPVWKRLYALDLAGRKRAREAAPDDVSAMCALRYLVAFGGSEDGVEGERGLAPAARSRVRGYRRRWKDPGPAPLHGSQAIARCRPIRARGRAPDIPWSDEYGGRSSEPGLPPLAVPRAGCVSLETFHRSIAASGVVGPRNGGRSVARSNAT